MPTEPSDDQIRAEVAALIANPGTDVAPAPAAAAAPAETPPPATEAPPAATPTPSAPAPTEFQLDEATQRQIAAARRAQEAAQNERRQLAAERQQAQAQAAAAQRLADIEAMARTGKTGALLRALGVTPGKDHAEDMLADALGDDAPAELRLKAQIAQLARQREADRAELAAFKASLEQQAQQQTAAQQMAQQREYVRQTLLPQFGDKAAAVRALAADPEFADTVIGAGIQQYHAMVEQRGEADPAEAFTDAHRRLVRMGTRLMSDPAVAAEITKALEAVKPKQAPPPAEKPQPAPTLSNQQHTSTTPPVVSDWKSYEEQVRREVEAMLQKQR